MTIQPDLIALQRRPGFFLRMGYCEWVLAHELRDSEGPAL